MKPPIVFVAAFLLSTGASAGAKYAIAPAPLRPKPSADSLKAAADSTRQDTSVAVSGQPLAEAGVVSIVPTARADSAKPAAGAVARDPSVSAATPGKNPVKPPLPLEVAVARAIASETTTNDTATVGAERRVSKIFTAMEAKQAARVLEHMTDGDIHVILGYVGPRQAAAILAELKPERVAALSKLAMKPDSKP